MRERLSSRVIIRYTSGGGFLSVSSRAGRGENNATRKASANKPSNPNRMIVQMVGLGSPVTGTTPGALAVCAAMVGATTVIADVSAGGTTVSCNLTVCGAAGDPKALKNRAVRITSETKITLSFMETPFKHSKCHNRNLFLCGLYNEESPEMLPSAV